MRTGFLITTLLLSGGGNAAVAHSAPKVGPGWVNDGARSCIFDENIRATTCTQYHRAVEHKTNGRKPWLEFWFMWKASSGLEVHYASRIGVLGVGPFTIGELFDSRSALPGHASHQAVSYSPSKDELVIGVPGEGYEFSVKGGL